MKYPKLFFVLFLLLGCQKPVKENIAIGTWNRCNKDGSYWEYKITDKYMLMLTTKSNDIWLFRNKIVGTTMVLSEYENGSGLMVNNDTLVPIVKSKSKVVLKSTDTLNNIVLNKSEFDFDPIDSTNLESWKSKTLSEFKKRALQKYCPDLRTEKEKNNSILNLDNLKAEKILIETKEK